MSTLRVCGLSKAFGGIHAVQREYVLGKIDAERYDSHDFPSRVELMSVVRNPILALRCRFRALPARPAWDGEVPFIRWTP